MDPSDKVCHGSYGFRFAQKNVIKFGNFLGVADFYGLEILKLFLQISYEQSHAVFSLWRACGKHGIRNPDTETETEPEPEYFSYNFFK